MLKSEVDVTRLIGNVSRNHPSEGRRLGIFQRFAQSHHSFVNWSSALPSLQPSPSPTALVGQQQSFFGLTNLSGVVRILKKENDRLTREVSAIAAALSAFGAT